VIDSGTFRAVFNHLFADNTGKKRQLAGQDKEKPELNTLAEKGVRTPGVSDSP